MQDQQGNFNPHRPTLQIAITDEQYRALQDYIPHGCKTPIFSKIIDDLIKAIEVNPQLVISGLMSGQIKLRDFSSPVNKVLEAKQDGDHIHPSQPRLPRNVSRGAAEARLPSRKKSYDKQG